MARAISQAAQRTMDILVAGMSIGESRKVDAAPGVYMALHVERTGAALFSLAHYYEQNGDLMADPEMEFYRAPDGRYYPLHYQQDGLGIYRAGMELGEDGKPARLNPREQADQASFAGTWLRNIRHQQKAFFASPK